MAAFLPEGSLYFFIGVAAVLFTLMGGCFMYHKGKLHFKKPIIIKNNKKDLKRATRRNKFLRKKGEAADADEERGAAETSDKVKADIDSKYNNPSLWVTATSADPSAIVGQMHDILNSNSTV